MVPCLEGRDTIKLALCFFQISISLFTRTFPALGAIGKSKLGRGVAKSLDVPQCGCRRLQLARFERFFLELYEPVTDSPTGVLYNSSTVGWNLGLTA
jgi:hypothetical protein